MRARWLVPSSLCLLLIGCLAGPAAAQRPRGEPEAIAGRPFGVARFSVPLAADAAGDLLVTHGYELHEKNGRAFYPTFGSGRLSGLAELLGVETPAPANRLEVAFLFTGTAPLEITLYTPQPQTVVLQPQSQPPRIYERALFRWWREYNVAAQAQERQGDYPPLVETYLTSMLAGRLGLRPPLVARPAEPTQGELQQSLELVFGTEKLRHAILRETMRGGGALGETATLPVPESIAWTPLALDDAPAAVEIEEIARHVPHECFYIRFGNFSNYLWLTALIKEHGGDIGRMVMLRGHDAQLQKKMESQLALKQSALAEVLGPQVIADVAIIGRDLYLREGAALGMLFQARNNLALSTDITSQRNAALAAHGDAGATLGTVSIAGREVSLLVTPDNRLRSYYAVDGDFHLVTTSRAIVERFFEAGAGKGSLGGSPEFQHARSVMPLARDDTVLAYFSSAFFSNLLSPQYQIELTRRLQAVTDIELVQLAQLAAAAEGHPHETLDELVAGGFLPQGFGRRGDGSGPVLAATEIIDSRRGVRGSFTPIPDMRLRAVTPSEAERFARRAGFYQQQWPQMDPLIVGLRRFALDREGGERLVIDANISPLAEEKYGWILSLLGPPTDVRIETDPRDVISMQASLRGGLLAPDLPLHHLFLNVQDVSPGVDVVPGSFWQVLQIMRTTPGYLGAWPQLGFLDRLPALAGQPDLAGFSRLPLGLWRWQGGGFSVLSFDRRVLETAVPHLQPVATDNPAQIRLRVGDLAHSQLAGYLTALNYQRAQQASLGNVRLLHTLSHQFRLPKDQALARAESLLDTTLVCSLGGKYELAERSAQLASWQSTAAAVAGGAPPADYQAPLLTWFRGARVEMIKQGPRLMVHAELDMQRAPQQSSLELPLFNLFGGGKKEDKKPDAEDPTEELPPPRDNDG